MRKMRTILTVLTLVLAYGATAQAGRLVTPVAIPGSQGTVSCVATNFGTNPADITIQLFNELGAPILPDFDNCSGNPIGSGHTCVVGLTGQGIHALCNAKTSSRKVHMALEVINNNSSGLVVMFPATKP